MRLMVLVFLHNLEHEMKVARLGGRVGAGRRVFHVGGRKLGQDFARLGHPLG